MAQQRLHRQSRKQFHGLLLQPPAGIVQPVRRRNYRGFAHGYPPYKGHVRRTPQVPEHTGLTLPVTARRHRSNFPRGQGVYAGNLGQVLSRPAAYREPVRPPTQASKPWIRRSRRVHTPTPLWGLGPATHRAFPWLTVAPFVRLADRKAHNPRNGPPPYKGHTARRKPPVMPPLTGLTSIPVERSNRRAQSPPPHYPAGAYRRGRVPAPTAPFLLREGRRLRGTRPPPHKGHVHRARVPLLALTAKFRVPPHRFAGPWVPSRQLFAARIRRGLLFHTGLSSGRIVFECDPCPRRIT